MGEELTGIFYGEELNPNNETDDTTFKDEKYQLASRLKETNLLS